MQPRLIKTEHASYVRAEWNGNNEAGFRPFSDKILVLPDRCETKTAGGIIITPDQAWKMDQAAMSGTIIDMGPDAFAGISSGHPDAGDHVFFEKYSGQIFHGQDGKIYRLMDAACIGGISTAPRSQMENAA